MVEQVRQRLHSQSETFDSPFHRFAQNKVFRLVQQAMHGCTWFDTFRTPLRTDPQMRLVLTKKVLYGNGIVGRL